ncbi:hypothetical protein [Neobacillus muris]|nr:hypothetical protein [Neobacillus muris]
MAELLFLCFVTYLAAFFCLRSAGQSMEVRPIESFDDYFPEKN